MEEFVIEWIRGKKTASVTCPSNSRLAGKIRKLAENSLEISIIADENGALFAHVPVKCVTIRKPTELTEEQRQLRSRQMEKARKEKNHGTDN